MLRKKLGCLLVTSLILFSTASLPVYARDTTDNQQHYFNTQSDNVMISKQYGSDISKDEESLKIFLRENEVSEDVIDNLINKIEDGEVWDCLKEEFKDITPISVQNSGNGFLQSKYVYPDGSIRISIQPSEETNITARSVGGGSWSGGSGYKNCKGGKVAEYTGIANVWFYADFTIVQGGDDYISRVYDYSILTFGGDYKLELFERTRPSEGYGDNAEAKLQFKYLAYGGSGSATCWLKLVVGNDKYYSVFN